MSDDWHVIEISWRQIKSGRNSALDVPWALYAYFHHADSHPPIYVGRAINGAFSRITARDKQSMHDAMAESRITPRIFVGHFGIHEDRRMSDELLSDVESLLIKRLQPAWNTMSKKSRGYSRPGMVVRMFGTWPHPRSEFRDR